MASANEEKGNSKEMSNLQKRYSSVNKRVILVNRSIAKIGLIKGLQKRCETVDYIP